MKVMIWRKAYSEVSLTGTTLDRVVPAMNGHRFKSMSSTTYFPFPIPRVIDELGHIYLRTSTLHTYTMRNEPAIFIRAHSTETLADGSESVWSRDILRHDMRLSPVPA